MILMVTDIGFTWKGMATFGSLTRRYGGRHIKREDGFGSLTTDGPGYHTSLGDGLPTITDGGFITETTGAGGLDRFMSAIVRYGLRHLSSLWALDTIPASALAPSDGFPWGRMIAFIPGTAGGSITSTSRILLSSITSMDVAAILLHWQCADVNRISPMRIWR